MVMVEDFSHTKLSFDEQVNLVSTASLVIGLHGSGIATSVGMKAVTNNS